MRKVVVAGLAMGWLLLVVPQTQAFWFLHRCCAPPCYPVVCPPPVCVKVECVPVKCTIMVPKVIDVKKTINVCIPTTREVLREVCCVKYVSVPCVDCNGCTYTCLKPTLHTQMVKCVVPAVRYETREVLCKSVTYVPQEVIRHVYRCVPVACGTPMPEVK